MIVMLDDIKLKKIKGDCPSCRFFDDFGCVLDYAELESLGGCKGICFKEV